MAIDVPDVRRRLRGVIESARKTAQERRVRHDRAAADYEDFLRDRAVPTFHTVASALVAEGHRFKVHTPAGSVRLASELSPEDFIELTLDTTSDRPVVVGRINRGRGRRLVTADRPVREDVSIAEISDEDVLSFLMREIVPFVER